MEQVERDEAIRTLLAQQAEINAKLGQLGIKPGARRETKAPDGGAISDAHQFLNPKMVKTMRVRLRNVQGSDEAIIRADQFDPKKHESLEVARTPREIPTTESPKKSKRRQREGVRVSEHSRDELLTMTIPVLRALPEVQTGMDSVDIPERKGELVDAILKVREGEEITA